jgi:urease accessory protein
MAALVLVAETAEAALAPVRARLPETGGASLLAPDVLTLRLLAPDGEGLRRALLPILDLLTDDSLPRAWRL